MESIMAGYTKIWTTIYSDSWFLSLSGNQRGLWLQMLVWAKLMGDTGHIFGQSYDIFAQNFALDRRTLRRYLTKMTEDCRITVTKMPSGGLDVFIRNYQYWQSLKRYKDHLMNAKNAPNNKQNTSLPSQSKSEQVSVEKEKKGLPAKKKRAIPDTNHAKFIDYFSSKHKNQFEFDYPFESAKDGKLVKELLKAYKIDILLRMIDVFFADRSEFLNKAGYKISTFQSQAITLAQKQSGKMPEAAEKEEEQTYERPQPPYSDDSYASKIIIENAKIKARRSKP